MRTQIPDDVAAEVMFRHDRTCCVCNDPGKSVQIHHIDENPSNHDPNNLAVLCLVDHDETQLRGGFGRKLRAPEVTKYRDDWLRRVRERREMADKILVEQKVARQPALQLDAENWKAPSAQLLAICVNGLPDVLKHAYDEAAKIWNAPGAENRGRVIGTSLVINVVEQSWVQLAAWFSPRHFGGEPPRDYFSRFLADRNVWNRSLVEAKDFGYKARVGTAETLERTLIDAQLAVEETVGALGSAFIKDFDYKAWLKRWAKSKQFR